MRGHVGWWRVGRRSPSSRSAQFCTVKHKVFVKTAETEIRYFYKTIHFLQESCMALKVWCSAFAINSNAFAHFCWLLTPHFFIFVVFSQSSCSREAQHEGLNCGWERCLFEAKVVVLLKVFIKIASSVMNRRSDVTMWCCYFCLCFHSNSVASLFFCCLDGACCILWILCFLNTFSRFDRCDDVCIHVGQWGF